jgi:hypothetical protein
VRVAVRVEGGGHGNHANHTSHKDVCVWSSVCVCVVAMVDQVVCFPWNPKLTASLLFSQRWASTM